MQKPQSPIEQYLELLRQLAEKLPFEAEPAHYEKAQEKEAP